MGPDIEMDVQSKHNADASSEQILDKTLSKQDVGLPIASNVKPRSKLRLYAILTALFVS